MCKGTPASVAPEPQRADHLLPAEASFLRISGDPQVTRSMQPDLFATFHWEYYQGQDADAVAEADLVLLLKVGRLIEL